MILEHYMNLKKRNKRAKELTEQGYNVRKSCTHNQQLHPMYVQDWPEKLSIADKSLGNTIYKTHFPVLYKIEAR